MNTAQRMVLVLPAAGALCALLAATNFAKPPTLLLPAENTAVYVTADLPDGLQAEAASAWRLVEADAPANAAPVQLIPGVAKDGNLSRARGRLVTVVPARESTNGPRRLELRRAESAATEAKSPFAFDNVTEKTVQLSEENRPVFVYNHGVITDESVPETDHRRDCSCYLHPVWGLSGEVLTDVFPPDHFHHHGIFWRWKTVEVGGKRYTHWTYSDIQTRFVRWLHRETGPTAAVLAVENGWFTGDKKVMIERVWLRVYRSDGSTRSIDIDLTIIPTDEPVTLTGAAGKSYGGLTMRFDAWPRTDAVVRAPGKTVTDPGRAGLTAKGDLANTPLTWADFSDLFPGAKHRSGAALFVDPRHPDYPPSWLTRCYGPLCIGWPGVESKTLEPGKPVTLKYRVWIHKTELEHEQIEKAYAGYKAAASARWESE